MEENMQQGNANNFWLNFSTYFLKQKFREIAQYFFKWANVCYNFFFSVSTMIGNLRNMATDMGTEVQNQNSQLDRINLKVMIFFLLALIFVSFKKIDLFQERFYYDITINSWSNLENSKDIYLLNKIARSAKHIIIFILKEEGMILLQLCIFSI